MKHATKNKKLKDKHEAGMLHASCFMLHVSRAKRESGMTLAFTLIIVSTILVIALAMGVFSTGQMKIFFSAKDSAYAIFAGTSGLERALYQTRVGTVNCNDFIDDLATDIVYKYDVKIVADTCGSSPTSITSTGTYRQTSRKIEANW